MSTRDSPRHGIDRRTTADQFASRYDVVLAFIPVAFLLGFAASVFLSTSLQFGLVVASTVSVAAIVDSLFLNPPIEEGGR